MEEPVEWRRNGSGFRTVAHVWLAVTLLFLVAVLVMGDVRWITVLAAVLNVSAAALLVRASRTRTAADAHGIEITGEGRTRRLPWADVAEVRAGAARGWTRPALVEVHLTDGSIVALPVYVLPSQVPQLEALRAAAQT